MIKVLVIDDSALMRAMLSEIISAAPDMKVVGTAPDPLQAREQIKLLSPDVLTLDVEMPKMDGLEFLGRLMRLRPMPVVMVSSSTERGSETTLQALELGAFDYVSKPRAETPAQLSLYAEDIRDKIRAAYAARNRTPIRRAPVAKPPLAASGAGLSTRTLERHLIAIGSSTGGTEALRNVLCSLPRETPGIVMTQHMPETFTGSFARRLDSLSALTVVEAKGGERIQPGHAYLAPGHSHLLVRKQPGGGWITELAASPPVNRHRPSVDVLFNAVAEQVGAQALGVILTGMGKDGAQGMLAMRRAGAWNIGQDKDSCVVYGMPREAAEVGALTEVAPLDEIGQHILAHLRLIDRR